MTGHQCEGNSMTEESVRLEAITALFSWYHGDNFPHVRELTLGEIFKRLDEAGFNIVKSERKKERIGSAMTAANPLIASRQATTGGSDGCAHFERALHRLDRNDNYDGASYQLLYRVTKGMAKARDEWRAGGDC